MLIGNSGASSGRWNEFPGRIVVFELETQVPNHRQQFIEFAIGCNALKFGTFKLKSGRSSPYFFNAGLFNTGERLGRLADFYATTFLSAGIDADMLYGPAYKGIPLACATAMKLAALTGRGIPFAFNRKEAKDHGEGGEIVGSPLSGKVLIVDDVITAGTSVRESVEIIRRAGATPSGVLILLDRQEIGSGQRSATKEVTDQFGLPVHSVANLGDIIGYLRERGALDDLESILRYQASYGVAP